MPAAVGCVACRFLVVQTAVGVALALRCSPWLPCLPWLLAPPPWLLAPLLLVLASLAPLCLLRGLNVDACLPPLVLRLFWNGEMHLFGGMNPGLVGYELAGMGEVNLVLGLGRCTRLGG